MTLKFRSRILFVEFMEINMQLKHLSAQIQDKNYC